MMENKKQIAKRQKHYAKRAELVTEAKALIAKHDYQAALAVLNKGKFQDTEYQGLISVCEKWAKKGK